MDKNKALLSLENFSFSYDGENKVLNNLNIDIYKGEKIAVLGKNGAGKSTFLLCLNGVIGPDRGKIIFKDREINRNKKDLTHLRKNVGIVFQDANTQLIGSNVKKEISFGLLNLGIDKKEAEIRTEQIIEKLNLGHLKDKPPHYLSGGEKKRVTIADILVMEPDVILFDEPEASLDNYNRIIFEKELEQLEKQGKTLIVSSHNGDFAWQWATRILIFSQGEIIADGTPEAVFADDTILEESGLVKPMLYEIGEKIRRYSHKEIKDYPKSMAEMDNFIDICFSKNNNWS